MSKNNVTTNSEKKKTYSDLEKKEIKFLIYTLSIGFILRLIYILEIQGTPFVENLISDSKIYFNWAAAMADGFDWFGTEPFFMAPIYPYILSFIILIFGKSVIIIQLLQVLVSISTIVLIYLTAKQLFGTATASVSALISAIYIPFIFYSGAILSETLQAFCLIFLIYQLSISLKNEDSHQWFFIGIILGILALFRGNILIFVPGLLVWLYLFKSENKFVKEHIYKIALIFIFGVSIPILLVTARNLIIGDDFVILTSNGGINFQIGNNEKSPGVFVTPTEFEYYDDMAGHKFAEKQVGRTLKPSEASSYWYSKGFDFITQNPGSAFSLFVKKAFLFFGDSENPQSTIMDINYFARKYSRVLQLPLPTFLFVSLLALSGLIFGIKQFKKLSLIYIFIAAYLIGHILFFVNGRFRIGLTPLLIIFAGFGITKIFDFIKEKKYHELKIPIAAVVGFVLIYNFVIDKPVFNDYEAYMQLGDIAFEKKDYDEAIENYNRSLFYRDFHKTYMNIGNAFALKKDFRNAISSFNKAINRDPSDPMTHFNLGFAYTQIGNFDSAAESYKRAIDLDPQFAGAYRNMGIILYVSEKYEDALFFFEKFLTLSSDEEINQSVRQDIEQIKIKMNESNTEE